MNNVCISGRIHDYRTSNKCVFLTVMVTSQHETQWLDVTLFENQAKFFLKYFEKGKYINIIGHLRKTNYNGNFRQECIADNISFCGAKQDFTETIPQEWIE